MHGLDSWSFHFELQAAWWGCRQYEANDSIIAQRAFEETQRARDTYIYYRDRDCERAIMQRDERIILVSAIVGLALLSIAMALLALCNYRKKRFREAITSKDRELTQKKKINRKLTQMALMGDASGGAEGVIEHFCSVANGQEKLDEELKKHNYEPKSLILHSLFNILHLFFVLLQRDMLRKLSIMAIALLLSGFVCAQEEDDELLPQEPVNYKLKLQVYRYVKPVVENGDTMWCYLLPELWVYPPLKFKSEKQRRAYNRLVYNVKKVLPIAQQANALIEETYEALEAIPTKKEKQAHISAVEKEIKEMYTPQMKKLTYSQGKLLIKLVDRECNQSSYEIVQAFLGPARAAFYQVFAWTFRASLKKEYHPEEEDKLIERVVRQVETGQI